jgi:hypothetical protein
MAVNETIKEVICQSDLPYLVNVERGGAEEDLSGKRVFFHTMKFQPHQASSHQDGLTLARSETNPME